MQSLKEEFASLIDEIGTVQSEITKVKEAGKNIKDLEIATASWYDIVRQQINNMKLELQKIREVYSIRDVVQHKNGLTSSASIVPSSTTDIPRDEDAAVECLEQQKMTGENDPCLQETALASSELEGEMKRQESANLASDDINMTSDSLNLDMDAVDYGEEELYEALDEVVEEPEGGNAHEDGDDAVTSTEVNDNGGQHKESETVSADGEVEDEQSTQSSQPLTSSSSSSSYTASPVVKMKTRVSIHREFDRGYEQQTDTTNWQLYLGQDILVRSAKDNQWYPGVILDISYRNCRAYRYQVLSEGKRSRVKGCELALMEHCGDGAQNIAVGSRVVSVYGALEVLYAGIIAEISCKENKHRVLVFYDDGFAQYTSLDKIHLVCESGCNIWEEVVRHSRDFIQRYLESYPIRPMVRLKVGEELFVEWRGRWMKATVTQVDCSLVGVLFVETRMHEWLYRGSTRLEPIYIALASKKRLSVPQKKCRQRVECTSGKRFLVVYDHFDNYSLKHTSSSPNMNDNTGIMTSLPSSVVCDEVVNTSAINCDDSSSVGTPSTDTLSLPVITVTEAQSTSLSDRASTSESSRGDACSDCSELETLTQADGRNAGPGTRTDISPLMKLTMSKQRASPRHSTSSASPSSKRLCLDIQSRERQHQQPEFHSECGVSCAPSGLVQLEGFYNPLAIPLLNGWTRQSMEVNTEVSHSTHHRPHIYYVAPCGRRLRSIAEVDQYLSLTDTTYLSIDQFCYSPSIAISKEPTSCPTKAKYYRKDISDGKEKIPVPCINELQDQAPPTFQYSTDRVCSDDVMINIDHSFLIGCDCTDGCRDPSKCACARLTAQEGTCMVSRTPAMLGYNYRRLERDQQSAVYECNSNCRCGSSCANRLVQLGLQLRLQIFRTDNKGWGLRCIDDIPKGTFICTYSGDIHTDAGANKKGCRQGDEYFAELDYIEVMERHKEGYESEMEVSSLDYLSDEFTMQSSEDEMSEYTDGSHQLQSIQKEGTASSAAGGGVSKKPSLKKAGLKLHHLTAKPLSQSSSPTPSREPSPLRNNHPSTSPLAEVVLCDSSSSDDEQLPCYFPSYSLRDDSLQSPSCSAGLSDTEQNDPTPDDTENDAQRHLSICTNVTLSSSVLLHTMRRKLFDEGQCYVMDAKLQGNIGRFLNHSCQPNLFVQNVFVDTHDLRFPWVAFFTNQNVKAMTELTWDYNYEVGSVPDKELPCYCGAANCRKRLL